MRLFLPVLFVVLSAVGTTVAAAPHGDERPRPGVDPCAVAAEACQVVSDAYRAVLAVLNAEPQDGLRGVLEAVLGVDPCEEILVAVCGPPSGG